LKIAVSIDPLSQETLFFSAYFDYMSENYKAALEKLNRCLDHNPKNIPVHTVKCYCLLKLGCFDEVLNYFEHLPSDILVPGERLIITALAYALKKDVDNSAKCMKELTRLAASPEGFRTGYFLLLMYAVLGDKDKAFEWIRKAIEDKSPLLLIHFVDPLVDSLKTDPRYIEFQKQIFPEIDIQENSRSKKALLDDNAITEYIGRLYDHIQKERPYLNSNLSLRMLAEQVGIHPNELSWLLNESIGKNFSDFINHYRVNAFKMLSRDPKNSHLTLIAMAYDSGFNSKTVFNTYFKKETGLTPKQFFKANAV
jgi:AraC-like DNA-binding protein